MNMCLPTVVYEMNLVDCALILCSMMTKTPTMLAFILAMLWSLPRSSFHLGTNRIFYGTLFEK